MACASWRATSASAASSLSRSRADAGAALLPVAARISESLVEVSPSTLMQLKERSATRSSRPCSSLRETRASVAMKPSIVAMSGRIMPAPLAMPVTQISPLESLTFFETALGVVSVVMIASAAESQSLFASSALGSAAMMRSAGSGSMITPVENGSTSSTSQPRWPASASQTCSARLMPSSPVPALALPVLTTSACTAFFTFLRARTTGAAQKRFCVNTPATVVPGARRITSRSLRPGFFTPAIATPRSTPGIGSRESAFGSSRLTATINRGDSVPSTQLAVALLVFLARTAGARVVAADLLSDAHRPLLRRLGDRDLAVVLGFGLRGAFRARVDLAHVLHVRFDVGLDVFLGADLHRGQGLDHFQLHRFDQRAEQLEGLALVFLLRVLLRVA